MEFYIKKNSTLPVLKMEIIKDGRSDFNLNYFLDTNNIFLISLYDKLNDKFLFASKECYVTSEIDLNNNILYYINYQFTNKDTLKEGRYEVQISVPSEQGIILLPLQDKFYVNILNSFSVDNLGYNTIYSSNLPCCGIVSSFTYDSITLSAYYNPGSIVIDYILNSSVIFDNDIFVSFTNRLNFSDNTSILINTGVTLYSGQNYSESQITLNEYNFNNLTENIIFSNFGVTNLTSNVILNLSENTFFSTLPPTRTPSSTPTPTITSTPTASLTQTTTVTPTNTSTPANTNTPTNTQTPTVTPTNTQTPTPTQTNTQTPTQTNTQTLTNTSSETPTQTPTLSENLSPTPTPTNTSTPTFTPTNTQTNTPTSSNTETPTQTVTPTNTETPTQTVTPTNTISPTNTSTTTQTPTNTPTNTQTNTPTNTETPTNTPTNTETPTNTPTNTETPTNTPTITQTPSQTPPIVILEDDILFITSGSSASINRLWRWNQDTLTTDLLVENFPTGGIQRNYTDLTHTSTKLWRGGGATTILEYDITLSPFTISYNRQITAPFILGEGLQVRESGGNNILIVNSGNTTNTQGGVYELDITNNIASSTFKFSFDPTGICFGDMALSTNNKLIVMLRTGATTTIGYNIFQYDYDTGVRELIVEPSPTFRTKNSFFVYSSGLYVFKAGSSPTSRSRTERINVNSPYNFQGLSYEFWLSTAINGVSQLPSTFTANFIV
jgi:hypothetical protein